MATSENGPPDPRPTAPRLSGFEGARESEGNGHIREPAAARLIESERQQLQARQTKRATRMSLGIFGTGYAGLVTSVCLAQLGHTVTAIDKDPDIVASLSDGTPTIHEPGLRELLAANLEAGRLRFTTSAEDGVSSSDIVFLCVGTPSRADGRADLCQVEEVARTIAPLLDGYKLIVEKSTVPARTADWIEWTIRRLAGSECEFDVASNPEFLREGSAVRDFLQPDRIII